MSRRFSINPQGHNWCVQSAASCLLSCCLCQCPNFRCRDSLCDGRVSLFGGSIYDSSGKCVYGRLAPKREFVKGFCKGGLFARTKRKRRNAKLVTSPVTRQSYSLTIRRVLHSPKQGASLVSPMLPASFAFRRGRPFSLGWHNIYTTVRLLCVCKQFPYYD